MNVRKAVVTAAAPRQHTIPLQHLVDRDGRDKSVLQLIVEEVESAGIEEIAIVIRPCDHPAFESAAGSQDDRLHFIPQPAPDGYGDAIYQARDFVGDQPFLHLVGDHLYLSHSSTRCARQLIDAATRFDCPISAVQPTREHKLPLYGAVGGSPLPGESRLHRVQKVLEKPTPTRAEQELVTAGMRLGYYLCFFGMHVLTHDTLELLGRLLEQAEERRTVTLSDALAQQVKSQQYLAIEIEGLRYNIGAPYGILLAQLALALGGRDRDQILTELVELLANRPAGELA